MASPVPFQKGRLLSGYGMRRGRRTGKPTYHAGVDIGHPAGRGTPIYAVEGGTVERVVDNDNPDWGFKGYGNVVVIRHAPGGLGAKTHDVDKTWSSYSHLDKTTVEEGQKVAPGDQIGEMGNTSTGKFPGMGVHLHLELRRPKSDGSSPFPGPYKQLNLDPKPWIEATGVRFGDRGEITLGEDSEAWYTSAWRGIQQMFDDDEEPVSGIDHYPRHDIHGFMVPESALGASPRGPDPAQSYEPPKFDRDVLFGLTPTEWAAAGAGGLILTSIGVGAILMKTGGDVRRNKDRRRKRRRGRRRTGRRRGRRRTSRRT